jgi:hypothetical protein
VLEYLAKDKKIEWEGKPQGNKQQNSSGGWWGGLSSYIWKSNTENVTKSGFKSMQL